MIICSRQRTKITSEGVMDSWPECRCRAARVLSRFRLDFHACLSARTHELSDLADSVLGADGPVRTVAGLSLAPEHRRGHGALYVPRSEPVHAYMSAVTGGLALGGPVTGCSQSAITCPRPAGGFTCHRGGEFTSRPAGGKQFPAVHADPGVMRFHHSVHGRRRHLSRPRGGACRAALEWQDLECATRAEPAGALRALRWATRSSPSQQSSR